MTTNPKTLYNGQGQMVANGWRGVLPVDPSPLTDPRQYRASPALADAVNVALDMGMPLLLTGEPGCGKSELASSIAWELQFPPLPGQTGPAGEALDYQLPLRFAVKSDTHSSELFYRFDTLGRFHKKSDGGSDPREFVTYQALGQAILYALGKQGLGEQTGRALMREDDWKAIPDEPCRCVVLIDEIDKAPREVPNDILNEIQRLSFKIPELFDRFPGELALGDNNPNRPVIIITSNDERPLPKAFLRRCVYHHMEPPPYRGEGFSIEHIVRERLFRRFGASLPAAEQGLLDAAIDLYAHLRDSPLDKPPNIAELLAWVYYLSRQRGADGRLPAAGGRLFQSSARHSLLKLKKDQEQWDKLFKAWLEPRKPQG